MKKRLIVLLACVLVLSTLTGTAFNASAKEVPTVTLPPVLIKGFTYSLPDLQEGEGQAYVNGEVCGDSFVADGAEVLVEYKDGDNTLVARTIPVVDTQDATDHSAYFYDSTGVVKAEETADHIALSFAGDGQILFANELGSYGLSLNMEFVGGATNFGAFTLTLTDAENENVSLTVAVDPAAGTITYGEETVEVGISAGMLMLKYKNTSCTMEDASDSTKLFTFTVDDNGDEFAGFSGGVYMTLGFKDVTGSSQVNLKRLVNQPLGHRDTHVADQTEPYVNLASKLESKQHLDEELMIPDFEAYDVFSQIIAKNVSVQSPSGVELFSGNVSDYTPCKIDSIGRYRVIYKAEDSFGNKTELVKQVYVNDEVAPVLDVTAMEKTEYALGDTVSIPAYTASDNMDQCAVDVILILPNSEIRLLTHDVNGSVTSYITNTDLYYASFGVSDTTFRAEQSGKYVIRFVAYDDVYNRTVVTVPFNVK